jgi:hypothetical protein
VDLAPGRARPRQRPDRRGQVDHAGELPRLDQPAPRPPHRHHRGPDRVSFPSRPLPLHPARGRGRHALVRGGIAALAAAKPRHHPARRNPRRSFRHHRAPGRGDRPLGPRHAAQLQRARFAGTAFPALRGARARGRAAGSFPATGRDFVPAAHRLGRGGPRPGRRTFRESGRHPQMDSRGQISRAGRPGGPGRQPGQRHPDEIARRPGARRAHFGSGRAPGRTQSAGVANGNCSP